jgi:hypothetical protein
MPTVRFSEIVKRLREGCAYYGTPNRTFAPLTFAVPLLMTFGFLYVYKWRSPKCSSAKLPESPSVPTRMPAVSQSAVDVLFGEGSGVLLQQAPVPDTLLQVREDCQSSLVVAFVSHSRRSIKMVSNRPTIHRIFALALAVGVVLKGVAIMAQTGGPPPTQTVQQIANW